MTKLKNIIVEKIKLGEVKMQPHWHFVLRTVFQVVCVVLVATLAVYLLSFSLFILDQSGLWFAPGFGLRGVSFFLMSSPWFLLSLVGLFLLLLYILVTHFSFSYQRPLVYSMLAVACFVIFTASIVHHFAMHDRIQSFAEQNHVPGFAPLYHSLGARPEGVTAGIIRELRETGFLVQTDLDEELIIKVDTETKMPPYTSFEVNDAILIFGDRQQDTIAAFGVKLIPKDLPPKKGGMRMHQFSR